MLWRDLKRNAIDGRCRVADLVEFRLNLGVVSSHDPREFREPLGKLAHLASHKASTTEYLDATRVSVVRLRRVEHIFVCQLGKAVIRVVLQANARGRILDRVVLEHANVAAHDSTSGSKRSSTHSIRAVDSGPSNTT